MIEELRKGRDWCELQDLYGAPGAPCGEVGHVLVSDVLPELRAALEGLPLKAVSKPIRSTQGVHVVQVTERQGAEPVKFEDVRDRVLADMRDEEYEKQVHAMVADLRRRAEIDINPRYKLPADKTGPDKPAEGGRGIGKPAGGEGVSQ